MKRRLPIVFTIVVLGITGGFAAPRVRAGSPFTGILGSPNDNSLSFNLDNNTKGQISLDGLNLSSDQKYTISAPGYSYTQLIPNGTAVVASIQAVQALKNELGVTSFDGKTVSNLLKWTVLDNKQLIKSMGLKNNLFWATVTTATKVLPVLFPHVTPSPSPQTSPTPQATPQSSPITTSTPDLAATAHLSLISALTCPAVHQHQWLEVRNDGDQTIIAENWNLQNQAGSTRHVSFTIAPAGKTTITLTRSFFSRDGDTLQLRNPDTSATYFSVTTGACGNSGTIWQVTNGQAVLENVDIPQQDNPTAPTYDAPTTTLVPPAQTIKRRKSPEQTSNITPPDLSVDTIASDSATADATQSDWMNAATPSAATQPSKLLMDAIPVVLFIGAGSMFTLMLIFVYEWLHQKKK